MHRSLPPLVALLCVLASAAAFAPVAGSSLASGPSVAAPALDGGPTVEGGVGTEAVAARPAPTQPTDRGSAASLPPQPTNGSVARMMLASLSRTNRSTVAPDLTTTLSGSTDSIDERVETLAIHERFDALESDSERQNLIIRALITLDDRSTSLVVRHRTAISAYSNGSSTERDLFRELAAIDEETRHLDDRLDSLSFLIDRANAEYLYSRITTIRNRILGLQNPVQQRISDALAAGTALPPLHVEAGDDAVVLAGVVDDEYVRASYFHANRNTSGSLELDTRGEAVQRVEEYYPWAWGTENSISTSGERHRDLFIARSNHHHGVSTSYFDMRSGNVYKEVHELRLSELPTRPVRETAGHGYRVVVNRTYAGGPMAVEVYDAVTGERVPARVSLDGGPFRHTGADGVRWLVEPRLPTDTESYTVRVLVDSRSITLSVSGSEQSSGAR